jgi:hypothetical protein
VGKAGLVREANSQTVGSGLETVAAGVKVKIRRYLGYILYCSQVSAESGPSEML